MLIEELANDEYFSGLPLINMLNDMQFSFPNDDLYSTYSTFFSMNLHNLKCCCRCFGL